MTARLSWGLQPPEGAPAAWGARAIQLDDTLDFVPNRQSVYSKSEGTTMALTAVLDRPGMRKLIMERYTEAYNSGKLLPSEAGEVTLFEDLVLVVKADTKGSYGYVYIVAYLDEHTHSDALPPVGSEVFMTVNNIGPCKVIRHMYHENYPEAAVIPQDPPEWYRKQNALADGLYSACTMTPSEFRKIEEVSVVVTNKDPTR